MSARSEGRALPDPSQVLDVPPSASRQQVEEAYLHCITRLRSAFLDLGGFDNSPLSAHQTFDSYVAGEANRMALAACRRASDAPGQQFNPLFVYGRPGLGKSHLLAALRNRLACEHPHLLVVSTTAERFTEELLLAMGNHSLEQFQSKYRNVDVLIVDGFHGLANRLRTQEELCSVLDALLDAGRQVVIASQSSPKDCAGLLDSLRSRICSGLVVEIGYPDLENRKAIVRQLAEQAGLGLTREMIFKLAHRIQHDVRELKGAVARLLAHRQEGADSARLSVDELLYDLAPAARNEEHTLCEVLAAVTRFYALEPGELSRRLTSKKNKKARQFAMYLARTVTPASLHEVAVALEATPNQVLYAVRSVKQNLSDPLIAGDLEGLHAQLSGTAPAHGTKKPARKPAPKR